MAVLDGKDYRFSSIDDFDTFMQESGFQFVGTNSSHYVIYYDDTHAIIETDGTAGIDLWEVAISLRNTVRQMRGHVVLHGQSQGRTVYAPIEGTYSTRIDLPLIGGDLKRIYFQEYHDGDSLDYIEFEEFNIYEEVMPYRINNNDLLNDVCDWQGGTEDQKGNYLLDKNSNQIKNISNIKTDGDNIKGYAVPKYGYKDYACAALGVTDEIVNEYDNNNGFIYKTSVRYGSASSNKAYKGNFSPKPLLLFTNESLNSLSNFKGIITKENINNEYRITATSLHKRRVITFDKEPDIFVYLRKTASGQCTKGIPIYIGDSMYDGGIAKPIQNKFTAQDSYDNFGYASLVSNSVQDIEGTLTFDPVRYLDLKYLINDSIEITSSGFTNPSGDFSGNNLGGQISPPEGLSATIVHTQNVPEQTLTTLRNVKYFIDGYTLIGNEVVNKAKNLTMMQGGFRPKVTIDGFETCYADNTTGFSYSNVGNDTNIATDVYSDITVYEDDLIDYGNYTLLSFYAKFQSRNGTCPKFCSLIPEYHYNGSSYIPGHVPETQIKEEINSDNLRCRCPLARFGPYTDVGQIYKIDSFNQQQNTEAFDGTLLKYNLRYYRSSATYYAPKPFDGRLSDCHIYGYFGLENKDPDAENKYALGTVIGGVPTQIQDVRAKGIQLYVKAYLLGYRYDWYGTGYHDSDVEPIVKIGPRDGTFASATVMTRSPRKEDDDRVRVVNRDQYVYVQGDPTSSAHQRFAVTLDPLHNDDYIDCYEF